MCAIPLLQGKIPPGVNFSGKVVTPPENISKMPVVKGMRACETPVAK
jgi:hypothetical protein